MFCRRNHSTTFDLNKMRVGKICQPLIGVMAVLIELVVVDDSRDLCSRYAIRIRCGSVERMELGFLGSETREMALGRYTV
jgi:hypothetical protein